MHRRRTVRNAVRAALAGLGVLGLVLTGAASASAAAPRVDVRTTLTLDTPRIAPGKVLLLDAETQLLRGTLGHFAVVVHLPRGLRYLHDQNSPDCRSSADHRTVWCPSYPGSGWAGSQLHVLVSRGIRPGTVETITATASIGRAVDPTPADNTARARLLVKAGSDFGLSWITPKQPLHPGAAPVVTRLVVTNHGRYRAVAPRAYFDLTQNLPSGFQPVGAFPAACSSDSGEWDCGVATPILPGHSVVFTFRWVVHPAARGKVLRIPVRFLAPNYLDPNPRNDSAPLVLRVVR